MLSRVADCVFWMSRYIERAENIARFVDVNQNLSLDDDSKGANQWDPLIATTGDRDDFYARYDKADRANVIQFLVTDVQYTNSIISCVRRARENARTVRETISVPMWEEINKLYLMVENAVSRPGALRNPYEFLNTVRTSAHAFHGITNATMSHDEAFHFVRMGRLLERADKTSRILDVKYYILLPTVDDVGGTVDVVQWASLLKSASALQMYRRIHGRIEPGHVAEFLILDRCFPRSIRFGVVGAEESLHQITGSRDGTFANRPEQLLGQLRSEFDFGRIDEIIAGGLHEFLDGLQHRLNEIGGSIAEQFFHVRPPRTQSQSQSQRSGTQSQTQTSGSAGQSQSQMSVHPAGGGGRMERGATRRSRMN